MPLLHRQYKTARTETRWHLLLKIMQMPIQTSASRGYVLFDIKVAFMPAVVWCHKGHTRILKLSAGCGHILQIVKAWQETQNLMHSAAWKKYSNFASKIYRRLLHFGTSLLQVPYNQIPTSVSALSLSVLLSQCDRERLLFILSVGRSLDGDIHGRSCFVILKF